MAHQAARRRKLLRWRVVEEAAESELEEHGRRAARIRAQRVKALSQTALTPAVFRLLLTASLSSAALLQAEQLAVEAGAARGQNALVDRLEV